MLKRLLYQMPDPKLWTPTKTTSRKSGTKEYTKMLDGVIARAWDQYHNDAIVRKARQEKERYLKEAAASKWGEEEITEWLWDIDNRRSQSSMVMVMVEVDLELTDIEEAVYGNYDIDPNAWHSGLFYSVFDRSIDYDR